MKTHSIEYLYIYYFVLLCLVWVFFFFFFWYSVKLNEKYINCPPKWIYTPFFFFFYFVRYFLSLSLSLSLSLLYIYIYIYFFFFSTQPSNTLCKILLLCTTEESFFDSHLNIYIQKDRIVMRLVLASVLSNFYMSNLENKVFNAINKPNIYLRYVDNILLLTNRTNEINLIQETFQNDSIRNFTQELNVSNKIPFFGVLIDISNINKFTTSTYIKPPNINPCILNFLPW